MDHIGRTKVVKKQGSSELDWLVVCPHCGCQVLYADTMKTDGINNCNKCNKDLHAEIDNDKSIDYELYVNKANSHEYEPYRYQGPSINY